MNYHKNKAPAVLLFVFAVSLSNAQIYETWVSRYDSSINGMDAAEAMVVDRSGNVYVTGKSAGIEEDFLTVKFGPDGIRQWVRRHNGTNNDDDQSNAIALDSNGNVLVTGVSLMAGPDWDILTIKYSPEGDTLWARYFGPNNRNDVASEIAVDSAGNVFVIGTSQGAANALARPEDFIIIKYSPDGDTVWTRRYNGLGGDMDCPTAAAADKAGNVYITGISVVGTDGNGGMYIDFATLKYDAGGTLQWRAGCNGLESSNKGPKAMCVDGLGNVYVTGESRDTVSEDDYVTVKYNAKGEEQWVARYDGSGGHDFANAIALDGLGNIAVTGKSFGTTNTGADMATIKYSPHGDTLWVRRFNGAYNDGDAGEAITADGLGNIFVTGYAYGGPTESDTWTLKYDTAGAIAWSMCYSNGDAVGSYDDPKAIAVDTFGNVYVAGSSNSDYALIKYSTTPSRNAIPRAAGRLGDTPVLRMHRSINNEIKISFTVPAPGLTSLKIYSMDGREVAAPVECGLAAGQHEVIIGRHSLANGAYYCVLRSSERFAAQNIVSLK